MPNIIYTSRNNIFHLDQTNNHTFNKTSQINSNINKDWYYGTEELLDSLPKAWTRSMLYFLITFTTIIVPWTMFSQVDETGKAIGRIEPKGATQKLDSIVTGNIISVNVKEGSIVETGQVLLQIDSQSITTEIAQTKAKLEALISRESQLEILKNQVLLAINIQRQQNQSQALEKMAEVSQREQDFQNKQNIYTSQKLEKNAQIEQLKQNIKSTETAYRIASSRLARDIAETARYRLLLKEGIIAQTKIIELEKIAEESKRLQQEAKFNIATAKLRLEEEISRSQTMRTQLKSDIYQAKLRLKQEQNSYQSLIQSSKLTLLKNQEQLKDIQNQITTIKSEIIQNKTQIAALNVQLNQRIIRSPINGTIFELPIAKPGAVVQTGQMLAQIAPKNAELILKAKLPNQHSGFVKVGMPVKIKFDAYPFQEYGILNGRVSWISPNSKITENSMNTTENYQIEISLQQTYLPSGKQKIFVTPGQTATAEVIIRQRRVIDFILDPFKKLQKTGLEF